MKIHSMTGETFSVLAQENSIVDLPGKVPEGLEIHTTALIDGESRRIFLNQNYPWNLVGKIYTDGGGEGSGIFIGENLVLTALHCVDRSGTKPQYFAPAAYADPPPGTHQFPYGKIPITDCYYWSDGHSSTGSAAEGALDYAVLKLGSPSPVGYAGLHGSFDNGWLKKKMWYHIGYPVNNLYALKDHKNGRPCVELDIAVNEARHATLTTPGGNKFDGLKLFTSADCEGGQSGGPLFTIKDNIVYVGGVLSQEGSTDSGFAGPHANFYRLVDWCRKNA